MAADERIHDEVVRGLAARGRDRLAGTFRAAVFGANDGLVSNLALVLGIGATGVPASVVLFTGIAGLLAGALSMGAGEYVSVRSQRELLEASAPDPTARGALVDLDIDANELALVYRARGMDEAEAREHAALVVARVQAAGQLQAPTDALATVAPRRRGGRHRPRRRDLELPVLRLGRAHPRAALDLRARRRGRHHHGDGPGGHRAAGHRRDRRPALGGVAHEARACASSASASARPR